MLIDSRSLSNNETIETDVCIVGAGIAGITLAREFIDKGFRVCLLESGGLKPEKATQSLYWGENIGHPYYPLDKTRIAGFGGSGHAWHAPLGDNRLGVRLRPLDEIDFEERDWVPHSGWPFSKSHLDPFYKRAQSVCQIGPYTYNVEDWVDNERTPQLNFVNGRVKTTIFQFGLREPFISDYRDEIIKAKNITTYIYANVVEIETNKMAEAATRLRVACLQGHKFWVTAKLFILAMGALEVPRLLLLSNKTQNVGLGNQNDLVGRFFMEHPHLWSGIFVPSDPDILNSTALYRMHIFNNVSIMGKLTLSEDVLRSEKLLNYCTSIHPKVLTNLPSYQRDKLKGINYITANLYGKVKRKYKSIYSKFKRTKKSVVFRLNHMTEQVPNPNSRIKLSEECDTLGRNRVQLDWQLSPIDIRSIIRAQEIIDEELRRAKLGRLQIELKDETPPHKLHGGYHNMGTTRMHIGSKKGVVNENCQVHGVSNLFIAGPSVFPTGGYSNPVLTIVALSLRLADYVKKQML